MRAVMAAAGRYSTANTRHKERPMILIGQYDSPFVRRVAIATHLYRIGYEHRPWSTFGDADRIAAFNLLSEVLTRSFPRECG